VLLPVYTFFLHSSFLVPLCNVHYAASTHVHLFCIPTYVS
jgi:hypothetical protein